LVDDIRSAIMEKTSNSGYQHQKSWVVEKRSCSE